MIDHAEVSFFWSIRNIIYKTFPALQEAICGSLEEYNQHIEELKQEMEEATESAKRIREDIQEMRNKYGVVESQEKCAACDFPLLNRPFYLFLCGHMFHYDCLIQVNNACSTEGGCCSMVWHGTCLLSIM